ncbi:GNAT family N-acetyltransferase [soil metagenome]
MLSTFPKILPVLETQRLKLRKVEDSDLEYIIPIIFCEGVTATDFDSAKMLMKKIYSKFDEGMVLHWGMSLKENDKVIGGVGFYRGFENNIGEIGYIIMPEYRNRGLVNEACLCLIDYALNTLMLSNISAYTTEDNEGSKAVLRKLSFTQVDSDKKELIKFLLKP